MVAFQFFQNQNFVRKKIGRKCVKPVAKGEKKTKHYYASFKLQLN